jgi:hypothetical protein
VTLDEIVCADPEHRGDLEEIRPVVDDVDQVRLRREQRRACALGEQRSDLRFESVCGSGLGCVSAHDEGRALGDEGVRDPLEAEERAAQRRTAAEVSGPWRGEGESEGPRAEGAEEGHA